MTVALGVSLCLHAAALVGWRLVLPALAPHAGGGAGPTVLTVVTITADEQPESDTDREEVSRPPVRSRAAQSPPPPPPPPVEPAIVPSPPIHEESLVAARIDEPPPMETQTTGPVEPHESLPAVVCDPGESATRQPDQVEASEAGIGSTIPAPNFIRTGPGYRVNRPPSYPPIARRRGQEGLVLLSVVVSARGDVIRAGVKQSSGFELLDNAALRAVREWKFDPGRVGARSVESETEVPVQFKLVRER